MAKTTFIDGNKSLGILGTRVLAAFLNKIFNHRHANVDEDGNSSLDYATATGSDNAYAITLPLAMTSLLEGVPISFKANHTNTGPATLKIGDLSAISLVNNQGVSLSAGFIRSGQIITVAYDGTQFQILSGLTITAGAELNMSGEVSATSNTSHTSLPSINVTAGDRIFVSAMIGSMNGTGVGSLVVYQDNEGNLGAATCTDEHGLSLDSYGSGPGVPVDASHSGRFTCIIKIVTSGTLILATEAARAGASTWYNNRIYAFFYKKT